MTIDINWCRKRRQKLEHRHCITEGKQKGESCQTDSFKKYCASRSRAYKHRDYHQFILMAEKYDKHGK
jgi:hypothetical protein